MAFAYADFTAVFPEFANTATYPQASFTFWQSIANLRLDPCRWGPLLDHGAMLFVAHNLVEQARNAKSPSATGAVQGPTASKTIDKLSKTQDVGVVTLAEAGDWNSTTYGIQFYQLMLIAGSGGRQF